jgi:hypothetical protein
MAPKKSNRSRRNNDSKVLKGRQIEALCRMWAEVARAILLRRRNHDETRQDQL